VVELPLENWQVGRISSENTIIQPNSSPKGMSTECIRPLPNQERNIRTLWRMVEIAPKYAPTNRQTTMQEPPAAQLPRTHRAKSLD